MEEKSKVKHHRNKILIVLATIFIFSLPASCGNNNGSVSQTESAFLTNESKSAASPTQSVITEPESATPNIATESKFPEETKPQGQIEDESHSSGEMQVHFLDVGQGLSIFIQSEGQYLIYDGGDRKTSSFVVSYLKKHGVSQIDYLICSHYDSDHMAGLIGCLNAFDVKTVINSDYEHDSKLYDSFMSAVADNGLTVQHPEVGSEFVFGSGKFTVLSPSKIVADSNANSVAIKLVNGNNSFIFTGDADHYSESAMCASDINLDCDVLSLGHHGSATSTSYAFLEKTVPAFAVISCEAENQYGHPHKDTLEKLESMEINIFRSDKQGTVIATSDGKEIAWSVNPCNDYTPGDENDYGTQPLNDDPEETIDSEKQISVQTESSAKEEAGATETLVWKSETGSKYHSKPNCGTMNPDRATQISKEQAENMGLGVCSKCF